MRLHDNPALRAALEGTDQVFGCISPLEVAQRARRLGGDGAEAFVRQLAWRDFHCQVLAARPDATRQPASAAE